MTHTPHELADEFPEFKQRIHDLKTSSEHFAHKAEEYHEVNRAIHRIEAGVEGVDDLYAEELKKKRLRLKDEISAMLKG
jgi:hypothetical protein